MRIILIAISALLAACASTGLPDREPPHPSPSAPVVLVPPAPILAPPAQPPAQPPAPASPERQAFLPSKVHRVRANGISLTVFVCDDRQVRFSLLDQAKGPGSQWKNAEAAAEAHKAMAAINGGFFTPAGAPLGKVIENGMPFGNWNRSSSLTSGVFEVRDGRPQIRRSTKLLPSPSPEHLLQSGPFLLEKGFVVPGLSRNPDRPRSFLLWDGRHHWALGVSKGGSLASLAHALDSQPIPGFETKYALNLDGGTSSQLWIGNPVKGGPGFHRPLWIKPVRNFILAHAK